MNGIICAPRRKADPGKQITSNIRYVRRELDISFRDRYPFNDDFVTKNTIPRSIKKTSNTRSLIEAVAYLKEPRPQGSFEGWIQHASKQTKNEDSDRRW